jgi:hypothetical protein
MAEWGNFQKHPLYGSFERDLLAPGEVYRDRLDDIRVTVRKTPNTQQFLVFENDGASKKLVYRGENPTFLLEDRYGVQRFD